MGTRRERAIVRAVDVHPLVVGVHALASLAEWHSECHDALGGRPYLPVPISPLRREEAFGGGHFDHLGGHLGKVCEPRET